MLYWPVTTSDGDLCNNTGVTIPGTPTGLGPNTFVTLGTTLTSPTLYISFSTVFAEIGGYPGAIYGPSYQNTVLPFASSEISTQCLSDELIRNANGVLTGGPGTPLNFADLNYPHASSVYGCGVTDCQTNYLLAEFVTTYANGSEGVYWETQGTDFPTDPRCYTIFDDYHPVLAAPAALTSIVPEWAACSLYGFNVSGLSAPFFLPLHQIGFEVR